MTKDQLLQKLEQNKVCQEGIDYVRYNPLLLVSELITEAIVLHPSWVLYAAGALIITLTKNQLQTCFNFEPTAAIKYCRPLLIENGIFIDLPFIKKQSDSVNISGTLVVEEL